MTSYLVDPHTAPPLLSASLVPLPQQVEGPRPCGQQSCLGRIAPAAAARPKWKDPGRSSTGADRIPAADRSRPEIYPSAARCVASTCPRRTPTCRSRTVRSGRRGAGGKRSRC
uniref:Uncharacterized protein n=1 Tax=Ditylum brightwellii TaxID=49249 RepID=A0A7S2EF88_9STRA|mmetsp:Transcript_28047/g.41729  ORF Transcript_28047/g.41729 Transcript_28047/m.41729 type:complete len:113 (+) Transcript_28047:42-380(+)